MITDALNSFLHIAKKPIQEAKTGPLAGLTVAIKDVIVTKDMPSTAGSKILEGYMSPYDATVVTKLKAAGAVLVGKTNCDEFAMGSSGENSAYGPTKNPWDVTRVPGGSSSGSAAAVAAGYVRAALGTDTGGSIRQPAAFCGVVGLKPTYGSVSRYGLIALASSLDVIGTFARDVATVENVFSVISGKDPYDATTSEDTAQRTEDGKFTIGVPKEYFVKGMDKGVEEEVKKAIDKLKHLGHTVKQVSLPHTKYAMAVYYIIQPVEAASNLARYDGIRFGHTRDRFGSESIRRIMLGTFTSSTGYADQYYNKALAVRNLIRQDFDAVFDDAADRVDLIVTPTTPTTAFKLGEKSLDPLEMYLSDIFTVPANLAGIPGLVMPVGLHDGLPVGLQIMSPRFGEQTIFALARELERAVHFTAKPRIFQEHTL
ncbi:Asp-tRNA(Asn)/Glu-tRNA(Gln) amidotransferase subunit GatA [Candidatus Berkelbacteria bacterium]|nr:Asp-tRNA(Asn)/Glu-tRNA(Gln) amidotransferase subunit GatA [Candidatus Berkelbacteria bacterium]